MSKEKPTETKRNARKGGKMIYPGVEVLKQLEAYKTKLEEQLPGIEVSDGEALLNLVHLGLRFAQHGPFERVAKIVQPRALPEDVAELKKQLEAHVGDQLADLTGKGD